MVGEDEKDEDRSKPLAAGNLWRRAPVWRSAVVGAGLITAATLVLWSLDQLGNSIATSSPPANAAAHADADKSLVPVPTPVTRAPATGPSNYAERERPQGQALMANVSTIPAANVPAAPVPMGREEEEAQARCHPHLLHAPSRMPQIDISQMREPSIGHVKLHFWVNGAGLVSREELTAANYGTVQEQQAEMAFAKQMTFTVPNTPECSTREIELIGDFFESRESTGNWATFVRLYPRFEFTGDGVLRLRD